MNSLNLTLRLNHLAHGHEDHDWDDSTADVAHWTLAICVLLEATAEHSLA